MGCVPYSVDGGRDRRPPRVTDDNEGRPKFEIPDIEEIGLEEVRNNKDKCQDYTNHTSRSVFLGEVSWANPIVNCIAYNIDKGLKPLCEQEERAKEELRETRDDRYAEEIEAFLSELEDEKELFVDHIYELADPIYDSCEDMEDQIETRYIKNRVAKTSYNLLGDILVNSECRRIYRVMESKANLACVNLDFRSFNKKR